MAKPVVIETPDELTWHKRGLDYVTRQIIAGETVASDVMQQEIGKPSSPGQSGAFFRQPEIRALLEPAGVKVSEDTGNLIRVWAAKPGALETLKEVA